MAVTDPYPGQPTDGQSLDAVPILAKFNALFQGIQLFDGSQINSGSVAASAMASSINPNTLMHDTLQSFVQIGCVWSLVSGLQGTMTSGVAYIANASGIFRVLVAGIGSYTFTASKDTYIDIDYNGNVYYQAVANGASSPSITANAIRVAVVVTNGSTITFVNQGQKDTTLSGFAPVVSSVALTVTDSLGNMIYPTAPFGGLIGYRQITSNFTTASSSYVYITGLSAPAFVPANRRVKLIFNPQSISASIASDGWQVAIYKGTTVGALTTRVGSTQATQPPSAANYQFPINLTAYDYQTTSGYVFYTVAALEQGAHNMTVASAGGSDPALISVELE